MSGTFSFLKSNHLAIFLDKICLLPSNFQLDNSLNWSNMLHYLGIFIAYNSKNLFDLNEQFGNFYAAIHSVILTVV